MTDRYSGLTVTFRKDIRDDDAEVIITAIRLIKGVLSVDSIPSTTDLLIATNRVKAELRNKLWDVLE